MKALKYPCLVKPLPLTKIWGGSALALEWQKPFSPQDLVGESLEFSILPSDPAKNSCIENGDYAGTPFSELLPLWGIPSPFPLVIKLLEARERLSLQNHPPEDKAQQFPGKTEAWYILNALPGAFVYKGFSQEVTPLQVRQALKEGKIETLLEKIEVQSGDFLYISAGTIHAIGAGITLLEVQQRPQITYRISDWGRIEDATQPRPLHLEEALAVLKCSQESQRIEVPLEKESFVCPYFQVSKFQTADLTLKTRHPWMILFQISGKSEFPSKLSLQRGQTLFIPRSEISFVNEGELLQIQLPEE
jgi:mannose-6-phosphate isomerase